jgi:WD40 repeat protein
MNFKYKYLKYKQKYLLSRNQKGGIITCKIPDNPAVRILEAHTHTLMTGTRIRSLVIHPTNNKIMATCCHNDFTVKIWYNSIVDKPSWTCVATLEGFFTGHKKSVTSIAFHPTSDPIILATGSDDTTIKLWEIRNNKETNTWSTKCITTLKGHSREVTTVAFHPIQPIIISGSYDNTVKVWQLCANDQTAMCVTTLHNDKLVYSVTVHPTANPPIIAVGCGPIYQQRNADIKLWSLSPYYNTGTLLVTLTGHTATINSVVFHPTNSNILASGSDDGTAKLWELDFSNCKNSTSIVTFGEPNDYILNKVGSVDSVIFCPNKDLLAISSSFKKDAYIKWWSFKKNEDNSYVTECEAAAILKNMYGNSLAYNKSGNELAVGSADGNVRWYLFN